MTLRTRRAHCLDGALVAAHCLERLGYGAPRLVGFEARNDDTHAVAVYRVNGLWGALGKSNFTTLRARDPVYRTLRELVMSYFDFYVNLKGEKSLVGYTRPFNLSKVGNAWLYSEEPVSDVLSDLDDTSITPILPLVPIGFDRKLLMRASKTFLKSSTVGCNPKGFFRPK